MLLRAIKNRTSHRKNIVVLHSKRQSPVEADAPALYTKRKKKKKNNFSVKTKYYRTLVIFKAVAPSIPSNGMRKLCKTNITVGLWLTKARPGDTTHTFLPPTHTDIL